jgi:DNA-binding NarL/FixJ family response regulator
MVRVLVAEDHPMFRDALQATLTLTGRFEVVAAVGSGEDAVAEALRRTPDVVVMDLEMPDGGGVAATTEILRQLPATRILVLTSYDEDRLVYAALRAGAHGYVLKSATTEEIVRAVQAVARGDGLFSGSVVERISRHLATGGGQWPFPLSRADPAGTRDLGADGPGSQQRLHRRPLRAQPQDRPQPCLQRPGQAGHQHPRPGRGQGPPGRTRRPHRATNQLNMTVAAAASRADSTSG